MPVRLGIMMVIILKRCNLISPEIFRGNFSLSTLNFICYLYLDKCTVAGGTEGF